MWERIGPRVGIAVLACIAWGAPAGAQISLEPATQLFAATTDDNEVGLAVGAVGGPPWQVNKIAETRGGRMLRAFGKFLYVIDEQHGTILQVKQDGSVQQVFDLGAASAPQDIHVVDNTAWVMRRDNPWLLEIDLLTGARCDIVDLSQLQHGQIEMSFRTVERDGKRLFVQVQVEVGESAVPAPPLDGVLAVVNLATRTLIDVQPFTPGIQGVVLQGAPPRLKMQKLGRTLYVSTSDERLDGHGGIEMVDLDALQSVGYALSEAAFGADLGGFVMTSEKGGYFVFHTDIVASTHLKPFTIEGGVPPGLEIFVMLGDFVDAMAYDAAAKRLFLPSGFSGFGLTPGVYVFDTTTDQMVGTGPIDTVFLPHDVVVTQ